MRSTFSVHRTYSSLSKAFYLVLALTAAVPTIVSTALANTALPASLAKLPVSAQPNWLDWSESVFAAAKAQNKLVILDVAAVWCHWCHVMDEKTYADKDVRALLARD